MNKNFSDCYVVEYSLLQNCFHCDKLVEVINKNLSICKEKVINDYKIIGIFETLDEAMNYAKICNDLKREIIPDTEEEIDKLIQKLEKLII